MRPLFCVAIWFYLFRGAFTNDLDLFSDGHSYFHWNKFFFDSFRGGTYPLWNPLRTWGVPVGFKIRFIGEFNPFLSILYIPYLLGAKYGVAYFLYALSYYVFGAFGLGLIAKRLFKDQQWALLSGALFLFSGAALAIFFNYCEVVLTVPMIWFFYFLIAFLENKRKFDFIGLTFSLMIIMTTYMPFYFITVFFVFFLAFLVIYPKQLWQHIKTLFCFFKKNKIATTLCVVFLIISILPGYITYKETSSSDISYTHRQGNSELKNAVATGLDKINPGSVVGPLTWEGLFSGLMYSDYYLSYFFLSLFIFPIILLSVFNQVNRRTLLLFVVSVVLFLISLTNGAGLHKFLYEHVFFFKLIRNIFYFFYMAVPFIVLLIVEQLKGLLERYQSRSAKWINILFVLAVHILLIIYMQQLGFIIFTNYLVVFLSATFFVVYILDIIKDKRLVCFLLLLLIIMQPIVVYNYYPKNAKLNVKATYREKYEKPTFFYRRPKALERLKYSENVMRESSGFITNSKFAGMQWVGAIQKNVSQAALLEYAPNKFYIYDNVKHYSDQHIPWQEIDSAFRSRVNVAYVAGEGEDILKTDGVRRNVRLIKEDSEQFSVTRFNLNEIEFKTNFDQDKFIVYNDGFHKHWHAIINGQPSKVLRANVAFKGLWVPKGEQKIVMRYKSKSLEWFYKLTWVLFYLIGGYLLLNAIKNVRRLKTNE